MAAFINGCGGGGFGDPAGGPIDHPDLVRIQVAAVEGFPDRGQAPGEPAGPGKQAAHVIGLVAQHHRKLIGYEFTWFGPLDSGRTGGCGSGGRLCEPRIAYRTVAPASRASAAAPPACICHRLVGRSRIASIVPRYEFIVAAAH